MKTFMVVHYFASLLLVSSCLRTGLVNNGNYCFINAAAQALHKCPIFVKALYKAATKPDANQITLALAQVMGRLTEFYHPVNMEWDFYPVYRLLSNVDERAVIPPEQQDSNEFISYLLDHVLPLDFHRMFQLKYYHWSEINGVTVRQPEIAYVNFVSLPTYSVTGRPLPEEFQDQAAENFKDPQIVFDGYRENMMRSVNEVLTQVQDVNLVTTNAPVMMLVGGPSQVGVPGFFRIRRTVVARDDSGIAHNFLLFSIICHEGFVTEELEVFGHYYAISQVDPVQDEWYNFDDDQVTSIDPDRLQEFYGNSARALFYIREDVHRKYARNRRWRIPVPKAIHNANLELAGINNCNASGEAQKPGKWWSVQILPSLWNMGSNNRKSMLSSWKGILTVAGYVLLGSGAVGLIGTLCFMFYSMARRSKSSSLR